MKYTVTFKVEDGNCELYQHFDPNDADSACKHCPLKDAFYCMDLDMHKAEVIEVNIKE